MKRKSLLFLLLMAFFAPWAANAQNPQLNEGFESTTFPPEDWASIHVSGANYWARYTTYKHSGDASAYAHWASSGHENYLITPKLAPASDESLSFYVAAQSYSGTTLYVKVSTTTADASAFSTTLATYTTGSSGTIGTTSPSTWVEKTIDLSDYVGQQIFIAFHVVDNNGGDVIIDDVTGVTLYVASCAKPTGLAVNNGVATWNAGTASQWNLKYKKVSDETWISVNGLTAASYTFSGLDAATDYEVQVQTDCGGGDLSDWTNSASFTTPCDEYDIPYTYGFEEAAPFDCWTVISGNITRKTSNQNNGTYYLDFRGTTSNMIALPQFNETTNNLRVEFYTRPESTGGSSGKFAIGYMTDITDASTFVAVATYNSTEMTTSYVKKTVDFVGVPARANIAMRQFDCATNYYWYVDDVTVKEIPSCVAPTALAADASSNSAELSWTANSNETAWTLYWKKTTDENYTEVANATNPYTLSGLTAATNYEYYVVANCSTDEASEPSEVFTFATECDVVAALGYSENFDSYTAGNNVLPTCWNYINTTTYSSYAVYPRVYANSSYSTYANSAPNCLYFYSYYSSYGSYDPQPQYAILPEMEGLAGTQVTLKARGYNTASTFKIGTMSDPTDASTFTMIAEQTLTTSYPTEPFEYTIPADCTDSYLAIMIDAANSSRTSNGVYIDDIVITTPPTCIKPTSLAVTAGSITNDGATITWTPNGSETQWQIEFATDADFTHPLYETVEGEPTYTFHGLDETTTYYVHVQAVCGGNDGSSEYSATVNFTTLQTPANLPYVTDFESENGWLFVNGNLTNAWAYGEATNNGGTHALYISNDGGTNNAYTVGSATMVYATKLFNFEAGTYVFSYDWKANGENNWDYLRVALVPSTVTLTPGTIPSVPSGSFYNNLPTGWIALDGGSQLQGVSAWQSYASEEIEIAAGTYMMVFAWRNDGSGGSTPPAAIDNVSIEKITCTTPTGLDAPLSGITATSAQLTWTETGEATAWQIELTDEEENVITIDVDEEDLVNGVYTIASLTSETVYTAKVRANCGDGFSRWSEEVIFETAADCQMSDGLTATATSNSAEISWNGYGQETFNLRYSTDGETWTTEPEVANPYTLAQLTPATTYYVQVQPTCADAETWSEGYSFHTECGTIVVTNSWSEGFEDGLSFCWDQDGEGTWTVGTGDGNTSNPAGAHTGNYNAKITHGTTGTVTKLITPVLDLTSLNNPMLTFWYINRKWVSDIDGFAVYYRTASNAAWTLIESTEEAHDAWTEATYMLPNPSATYQIAFEMTDGYGYGVGVDDIVIEDAPTYTLTIDGYEDDANEGGYYLIASPVTVDLTNHAMTTGDFDLYYFDQSEGNEWQNYEASAFSLDPGKGYLYAHKVGGEFTLTGVPYSGNGVIDLDYNGDAQFAGWNLVGNPWSVKATTERSFYTLEGGASINPTPNVAGTEINPMTGIFVVAEGENETVTFSTVNPGTKTANLALNLSNGNGLLDRAIVSFGEGRQLPKFQLNPNHTKVFIPQEGKDYAIVNATEMGELPVSFKAENNGSYTLSFTNEEVSFGYLHLIDNLTGIDTDLLANPSYSFEAKTTDYANRFKLVFATGSNDNDNNFAFFSNGSFVINNEGNATLQVVDVTGRMISSENINGCANVNVNAAPGVYMIRLVNGENVKVQKVVVR